MNREGGEGRGGKKRGGQGRGESKERKRKKLSNTIKAN